MSEGKTEEKPIITTADEFMFLRKIIADSERGIDTPYLYECKEFTIIVTATPENSALGYVKIRSIVKFDDTDMFALVGKLYSWMQQQAADKFVSDEAVGDWIEDWNNFLMDISKPYV